MDNKIDIKVYSTPYCVYCKMAKEFLKENNVQYQEIDVFKDEGARNEMVKVSGQMGVPVIDINGEVIIGFDRDKIKNLLHL